MVSKERRLMKTDCRAEHPMTTFFISDLHLSTSRPDKLELFQRFCAGPARRAKAVYLLGDLFEHFWVGNDDRGPGVAATLDALRACCQRNGEVYVMRGNRELMLDEGFARLTGCKLLEDETVVNIDGQAVLLMHGDLLCAKDVSYLLFRKFMETPLIRRLYLSFPYWLRAGLSHGLRPLTKKSAMKKSPFVLDVDQRAVASVMAKHKVAELIHGHTHRPGFHHFELNGQPACRIVLGDWYATPPLALVCRDGKKELTPVEECVHNH